MVRIRRPTNNRTGGNKLVYYGKYVLMGGIAIFLVNQLLGGSDSSHGGHDILNIQSGGSSRRSPTKVQHVQKEHRRAANNQGGGGGRSGSVEGGRLSGDSKEDEDNNNNGGGKQKIQYVSPNGEVLEKPEGTGPTKLGYVLDLVYERSHPTFREESIQHIETSRSNHIQVVATALDLKASDVQPCEYIEETSTDGMRAPRLLQRTDCGVGTTSTLVVYNSAPFPRTWCGVTIPPNTAQKLNEGCASPHAQQHDQQQHVHLFEKDFPPVNGEGMSPIIVHSNSDGQLPSPNKLQDVEECSIPCQMEVGMTGIDRYIYGTDWSIFQSYDDPTTRRDIQVELSKYKHDEYYSTAYFKSDIPLSRFNFDKHNLRNRQPAVQFDDTIDKGVYIVNDQCGATNSRRTRWLDTLENQYHIDSVGKCKHTKELEGGQSIDTLEGRLEVMKQYKFNLGFEISTHKDWVTELSFEAFLSGAVPIILGASNAAKHLPKNGAIYTNDYNNWDKLAAKVNEVANNKELWESYHAWRDDETILAAFERKYQFTKISPDCRLCSWAYAKLYGLGWDHELQIVQETHVPRTLCVEEETGLVVSPFQEIWASSAASSSSIHSPTAHARDHCSSNDKPPQSTATTVEQRKLEKDDWSVTKSIVQHDSVIDITIHEITTSSSSDDEITLTFAFEDVNNTESAFFRNSHTLVSTERGMLMSSATIQDHKSKITVLANFETNVYSPKQGQLRVVVQGGSGKTPELHHDEVRKIRIITEDMGQLHDKMTEYFPSSFSKRMIKDFVDPLEVFYLDS